MSPRHILVLGSTSPAGTAFCLSALRDSHTLTLYVRSPSKLPSEISSHPSVTVVTGGLTSSQSDISSLNSTLACGAKTCISFLGPILNLSYATLIGKNGKGGKLPVTDGYERVIGGLEKYGYERLMVTSTASYLAPTDRFSILFKLMVLGVYLFFRGAYDEINGFTPLVTSLDKERIKWTVFRVPMLRNGNGGREVSAGYVGEGHVGVVLDREALADWVLGEMEEEKWVGKCPALANA